MNKQKEALRLALEALEHEAEIGNDDAYRTERDAIREALAEQPAQQQAWPEHELRNAIGLMRQQDEQNGFGNFAVAIKALEGLLASLQPAQEPPTVAELRCVCGAEWEWRNRDWELVATPPASKPDFKAFKEWAGAAGYDTAHLHDGIKWFCLNPMTADLWKAWQAAHGIKGDA